MATLIVDKTVARLEYTADTQPLERAETAVQKLNDALQVLATLSAIENAALATDGVEKVRVTKHEIAGRPYPYLVRVTYAGDITETELGSRLRELIPADCELSIVQADL